MGASLSFGTIVLLILLIAVIFVAVLPARNFIVHAAENTARLFGIVIGKQSITTFSAIPFDTKDKGKIGMSFKLSLGGDLSDSVLEIYENHASADASATELQQPPASTDDFNSLIYTSDGDTSVSLKDGVINVNCPSPPGNGGCKTIGKIKDPPRSDFHPDWYTFSAVLKDKYGKTVAQKDFSLGVYTESYVELLNKPVSGCSDSNFHDCNVIECKKELINNNLLDTFNNLDFRRGSGVLRKISVDFRAEKEKEPGFDVSSNCGKVGDGSGKVISDDKDVRATLFVLTGCRDKDIDDLNTKVVRARMLETAYEDTGHTFTSEDQYTDPKYAGSISSWAGQAVGMTMSCTTPLGRLNGPKGAYRQLQNLGWVQWPPGDFTVWKRLATDVLSVRLSTLSPEITGFAASTNDQNQITVAWSLLTGSKTIKSYQLHFYRTDAAMPLTTSLKNMNIALTDIELPSPSTTANSYTYPASGGLSSASQMGLYWFFLSAVQGTTITSTEETRIGVYNDRFIELYSDFIGIDDNRFNNNKCDSDCDVIRKKIRSLVEWDEFIRDTPPGSSVPYTQAAYDKIKGRLLPGCKLDLSKDKDGKFKDKDRRLVGCSSSDVDALFVETVTMFAEDNELPAGKTVADLLKVDCVTEKSWLDAVNNFKGKQNNYRYTGISDVCTAKSNLKSSLDSMKWTYISS